MANYIRKYVWHVHLCSEPEGLLQILTERETILTFSVGVGIAYA